MALPVVAGMLLKYALPAVFGFLGTKKQSDAQREGDRAMQDYYDKALEAEKEEQQYRRGFDEDARDYTRAFNEEGRNYGRYADRYGVADSEERLQYGRAGDTYGRASDEERLAYDRSQAIRDKNYGYQQYGNFVETLEPFRVSGTAATSRMSGLIGGPTPASTGSYLNLAKTARDSVQAVPTVPDRPTWTYNGTRPTWNYPGDAASGGQTNTQPVSTTMPVGGQGEFVRVQAPDGEVRSLSRQQADLAVQRGARVVG